VKYSSVFDSWVRQGEEFGSFSCKHFREIDISSESTILGYTCGNLEQLRLGKSCGAKTIHIQIDPGPLWYQVRRSEQERYPELEEPVDYYDKDFFARVRSEIQEADKVIVHSEHSKNSLLQSGIRVDNVTVIPPAFYGKPNRPRRECNRGKLRVLYAGNICLAKGFHIFAEVARISNGRFEFFAAGNHSMRESYINSVRKYIRYQGRLSYCKLKELMAKVDLFVFPTLSDGFGLVQLEAMSEGIPVIATSSCGEVVQDGVSGFIVPRFSAEAILEKICWFDTHREMYMSFSNECIARVRDFDPSKQLLQLESV
jgi:glycosyltransferase involved in cell wall biosynthesis